MAHNFILRSIDPLMKSTRGELKFVIDDVEKLKAIIDPDATKADLIAGYELDIDDLNKIRKSFNIVFDFDEAVEISAVHAVDDLPYCLHAGNELQLMLLGKKPFAYFSESHPATGDYKAPEPLFDPYVLSGRFAKREYCLILEPRMTRFGEVRGIRLVLYALSHENWRIDAFVDLQNRSVGRRWTELEERAVGTLLGYEEWQNDAYIEYLKQAGLMDG